MKTIQAIAQVSALSAALTLALSVQAALPAAGTTSTALNTLTNSRVTAGEFPWVIRILSVHPDAVVPRRMYSASCVYNGQRKIFASVTTKTTTSATTQGAIISANVSSTGAVSGFTQKDFTACKEMNGIVAATDCSTVAAMCRRPSGSTGATKDLVASLPNTATGNDWRDWLTGEATDDHMWLYEWNGAPAAPTGTATPLSYVVSKAIGGGWEYGNQYLVYGTGAYGISMKSTTGKDAGGTQHQGDSFIVVNRSTDAIETSRGWKWMCAPGHTLANRPAFNPTGTGSPFILSYFAALCTTDWHGVANDYTKGGIWMHVENQNTNLVRDVFRSANPARTLWYNGGGTSLLPLEGGGFIGVIVGSDNPNVAQTTKIGLVRFNAYGAVLSTTWVASDSGHSLSYPQLVYLGLDSSQNPRYLLGWGRMNASSSTPTFENPSPDQTQRLASKYFVQEIDQYGSPKALSREVTNGWNEQDQMVSLGTGIAGWVYVPDPRYKLPLPTVNSTSLQWTTYKSTSM